MSHRRALVAAVLPLAAVLAVACGAFGSREGDDEPGGGSSSSANEAGDTAPASARSVRCSGAVCTTDEACCLDGDDGPKCAKTCVDHAFWCDDTADCAGEGKVCCVSLFDNGGDPPSAGLKGSSCRTAETCTPNANPPGLSNRRACDPARPGECGAQGCVRANQLYAPLNPDTEIYVCD